MKTATTPGQVAATWMDRLSGTRLQLPDWYHFAKLAEETGEAHRAYLRYRNLHRAPGGPTEVADELADVVITAYCCAIALGLDLDAAAEAKLELLLTRDLGPLGG